MDQQAYERVLAILLVQLSCFRFRIVLGVKVGDTEHIYLFIFSDFQLELTFYDVRRSVYFWNEITKQLTIAVSDCQWIFQSEVCMTFRIIGVLDFVHRPEL
jgi:hypothetical protein